MATTTYHAQLIKYLANGDQYILNLKNTGDDVSISRSSNGNLPSGATTAQGLANSLGALAFRSSLGKGDVGLGNVDNTADSAKSVKYATSAGSASSATKATQDSSSQTITSTYIKSLSVSGRTITFTRGNNTTGTITTQDTNTTYNVGTSTYSGTTKLYTTTGRNTDGTMTQKAISQGLANTPIYCGTYLYSGEATLTVDVPLPNNFTTNEYNRVIVTCQDVGEYVKNVTFKNNDTKFTVLFGTKVTLTRIDYILFYAPK